MLTRRQTERSDKYANISAGITNITFKKRKGDKVTFIRESHITSGKATFGVQTISFKNKSK